MLSPHRTTKYMYGILLEHHTNIKCNTVNNNLLLSWQGIMLVGKDDLLRLPST